MRNFLFFSAISYNFLTIPEKDFLVGQRYGIYETEAVSYTHLTLPTT